MDAATVVDTIQKSTIVDFFPKTETQARPLASLEPEEQVEAWKRVITSTPEGKITAAVIDQNVSAIRGWVTFIGIVILLKEIIGLLSSCSVLF